MNCKNNHTERFRQAWPCLVWMSLVLLIAGCQQRDEVIAGVDVPIPPQMQKIPDKGFDPIPGFDAGQASFQGRVPPGKLYTFYQEVMEAQGWKPDGFFAGEKDQLAYTKGNKALLITYHENGNGTSDLIIMVGLGRPSS